MIGSTKKGKGNRSAPVPLFDRLVDWEPEKPTEKKPFRVLDRDGLRGSIAQELDRLLNTRVPVPEAELEDRERSVIDYGIPDFANTSVLSGVDREHIAQAVTKAVNVFEPRLQDVVVSVEDDAEVPILPYGQDLRAIADATRAPGVARPPGRAEAMGPGQRRSEYKPRRERALLVRISGMMVAGDIREPATFATVLDRAWQGSET